jgi:hypothetical protein
LFAERTPFGKFAGEQIAPQAIGNLFSEAWHKWDDWHTWSHRAK